MREVPPQLIGYTEDLDAARSFRRRDYFAAPFTLGFFVSWSAAIALECNPRVCFTISGICIAALFLVWLLIRLIPVRSRHSGRRMRSFYWSRRSGEGEVFYVCDSSRTYFRRPKPGAPIGEDA
jgi:hypothetical protein